MKLRLQSSRKFHGLFFYQLGFIPENEAIYNLALLHKSASHVSKDGVVLNYERLEFLGDALLSAIVANYLYINYPDKDEGFLTQLRARIVSRESLNSLAITIGLNNEVVAKSDISKNKHIYGDVFEAFIGAMFIDQGFDKTSAFITNFILPNYFDIDNMICLNTNYKSQLIEWSQKQKIDLIFNTEEVRSRKGNFISQILIDGAIKGKAFGHSKKEAEQRVAKIVVDKLNLLCNNYS